MEIDDAGYGDITVPYKSVFRVQIEQYDPKAGTFVLTAKKSMSNNKWAGKWVSSSSDRGIGIWYNRDEANIFTLKNGALVGTNWSSKDKALGLTKKDSLLGFWDADKQLPINVSFALMKERPTSHRELLEEPVLFLQKIRQNSAKCVSRRTLEGEETSSSISSSSLFSSH